MGVPINAYYKGHGDEVMANMTKEYGDKKGESVFYALANKRHVKPMFAGGISGLDTSPDDTEIRRRALLEAIGLAKPQVRSQPGVPPPVPSMIPDEPVRAPVPPPDPMAEMVHAGSQGLPQSPPEEPASDMQRMVEAGSPPNEPATVTESPAPPPPPTVAPDQRSPQMNQISDRATPPDLPTIAKSTTTAMGPLRNQEQATKEAMDYARQMVMKPDGHPTFDPATGQSETKMVYKQPSMLSNILGAAMQLSPRTRGINLHPNLEAQYRNLDILTKRANEERQAQIAQSTEEMKRVANETARIKAEKDAAKTAQLNTSPSRLQWMALNDPDPNVRTQAASTLAAINKHDIELAGAKAATTTTSRAEATRNLPAFEIKPGSPEYRVAQDLAYGKLDMAAFRQLYSYSRDSGVKIALYDKARELNPNFNPKDFEAGYKFASSPKIVAQLSSLDNVIEGVPDLLKFSDLAARTGAPILNQFVNKGGYWIGDKHYSDFNIARIAFADELSGALGYGSATDMSRDMGFNMADPKLSPEAFTSAVQDVVVPFVQRKRHSITKMMGPYENRVPAPEYTPHTPASVPAPTSGPSPIAAPVPSAQPMAVTTPIAKTAPTAPVAPPNGKIPVTLGTKTYEADTQQIADQMLAEWRAGGGK